MSEAEQELEEYVEAFDTFLDKFTGKHEDSWIKQTLYPDTVQVRKDLIIKAFRISMKSYGQSRVRRTADEILEEIRQI